MTEVWVRNPVTCIRETAELVFPNIVWDRGFAIKNRLDPQRHLEVHYPSAVDYRILLVGDQGSDELRRGSSEPIARYPTWEYGEQYIGELEEMVENPIPGQEHRVVIIRPPDFRNKIGKAFVHFLSDMQEEYPDVILHYHGTYSWRVAFGQGFGAADIDPVSDARRGKIMLPSGRLIPWEKSIAYTQWIALLGFTTGQLSSPQARTRFNILSAKWAGENFTNPTAFKSLATGNEVIDPSDPSPQPVTVKHKSPRKRIKSKRGGDKLACDFCSYEQTCKYYRKGSVCSVPDTEGSKLGAMFRTKDSDKIIDGLGALLDANAQRMEKGLEAEKIETEGLDPEMTKLINSMLTHGVKLAKLVDPELAAAGSARIQIGINNGAGTAQLATPGMNEMIAKVARALEEEGTLRHEITPAMIAERMAMENRDAIEASSTVVP